MAHHHSLPHITVRTVHEDEIDAILSIEESAFVRTWDADRLGKLARGVFSGVIVATDESGESSETCGFLAYRVKARWFHVQTVAVDERHRGEGIGRMLMRAAIDAAKEGGSSIIYLEVRESNAAAITLYESLGFKFIQRLGGYYGDEDGLKLAIQLQGDGRSGPLPIE